MGREMTMPAEAFSEPCWYPYLVGVTIVANAVRDLYLVTDGPSCGFFRAEQVFGTHDLASTLLDMGSRHRAAVSSTHIDRLVDGQDRRFEELLQRVASAPFVPAVLVAGSPVTSMVGIPHAEIAARVAGATGKPIGVLPDRSLSADWVEGFADALTALARVLKLDGRPTRGRVAVVGYFMDRNEEDHQGNLRELRRMLSAIGLEVVSVWPGGEDVASMSRAGEAAILLALPPGRDAASVLSGRTGATVVPVDLPFGPDAADRFLAAAGEACGRPGEAAAAIREEEARWAPALKWVVLHRFLDTRWVYGGDPGLVPGIREIANLAGAELALAAAWSRKSPEGEPVVATSTLHGERAASLRRRLEVIAPDFDLAIGNDDFLSLVPPFRPREAPGGAVVHVGRKVEIGFRSPGHHAMFDQPYLGYRGFLCLVDRLVEALATPRTWA